MAALSTPPGKRIAGVPTGPTRSGTEPRATASCPLASSIPELGRPTVEALPGRRPSPRQSGPFADRGVQRGGERSFAAHDVLPEELVPLASSLRREFQTFWRNCERERLTVDADLASKRAIEFCHGGSPGTGGVKAEYQGCRGRVTVLQSYARVERPQGSTRRSSWEGTP